ncbi:hypothetical protein BRO54_0523 [Geobacillus proteiniphilus]|uniref:Uncharacterized protein n=1 Tax=Geobacillus proteiniphilus TaxID=860353 RepID=A0A1Q5T7A5_9BACL|nr:hypothetical protein BRO54_0523 [Geobacillus proteiniphilus]
MRRDNSFFVRESFFAAIIDLGKWPFFLHARGRSGRLPRFYC